MLHKKRKEQIPELLEPGANEPEFCTPGSIEQQLDMCEEGSLRGDEILHHHGEEREVEATAETPVDRLMDRYQMNMAEEGREGDELSGDEHSSGLQGSDPELFGDSVQSERARELQEAPEEAPLILLPRPERRAKRKHHGKGKKGAKSA